MRLAAARPEFAFYPMFEFPVRPPPPAFPIIPLLRGLLPEARLPRPAYVLLCTTPEGERQDNKSGF